MSISFPSNPSVDDEYQGWVWDGQKWISKGGAGGGGLWEENGDDIYYNDGLVGIGTDAPGERLEVGGGNICINRSGAASPDNHEIKFKVDGVDHASINVENSYNLRFLTNGSERMRIDGDGNVGIGTDDPTTILTLKRDSSGTAQGDYPLLTLDNANASGYTHIRFAENDSEVAGLVVSNIDRNLIFRAGGASERMRIGADGRVDITGSLYVNGSEVGSGGGDFVPLSGNSTIAGTLTATDFISSSDERLKDNITPMPIGLIDDIKPVSWEWKDGSGPSAGVVAQQLQSVGLGDYVHENEDGQLGVNYQALTAILLAEVIELKRLLK